MLTLFLLDVPDVIRAAVTSAYEAVRRAAIALIAKESLLLAACSLNTILACCSSSSQIVIDLASQLTGHIFCALGFLQAYIF